MAKGESRARTPTPQISHLSLSLPLLSPSLALAQVVVAQSLRRSAPTRAEPRERASPSSAPRCSAPRRWTRRYSVRTFLLRRLLRRGKQLVHARDRAPVMIFLGFIFCAGDFFFLIRVRGGVRRSDWRLRAGGGVEAMQRQGRHLERSNSKRALDHGDGADDGDRPSKRPRVPALAR